MTDMGGFRRYAIYWIPEPGPLADFGAAWLGWDAALGVEVAHPVIPGLAMPVADITATPCKYGFHGTVKPPFALAPGTTAQDLHAATRALAATLAPATMAGLTLHRFGPWSALVPEGDTSSLARIAQTMVERLDAFRTPPDAAEIARRKPESLTPRQREMLARWGYPYVGAEFQFHLTLTGPLPPEVGDAVATALAPILREVTPRPFRVADLCLCGEGADGRFRVLHRYSLAG